MKSDSSNCHWHFFESPLAKQCSIGSTTRQLPVFKMTWFYRHFVSTDLSLLLVPLISGIKTRPQTVKMSKSQLPPPVTVGDRDSPASRRLFHPQGKVILSCCYFLFFFNLFFILVMNKFCQSLLESVFKVGHGRGSGVLSVHGCTCVAGVHAQASERCARRSQLQCSCFERS